jgi:sugar phosphate isomerase/epimerase
MSTKFTRRTAFALAGGAAAACGADWSDDGTDRNDTFHLGVCTYSVREFSRSLAIKMIKRLDVDYVSVKDMHLPFTLTPQEMEKAKAEFTKAGLTIASVGNTDLREDPARFRRYFEYARACGVRMMVAAPTHENLPVVENLAKEFDIQVAIHTHGPEDPHFPSPKVVLDAVKGMDRRMGLCMDVGHSMRAGADIVQEIANAGPRLFDMHMKDLKVSTEKDSQCDVGEGVMPVVAIFRQLKKAGYRGCVNLEYEINSDDPLAGMLHSMGYMKGVAASLSD